MPGGMVVKTDTMMNRGDRFYTKGERSSRVALVIQV